MTTDPANDRLGVVTLRSLPEPSRVEAPASLSETTDDIDPVERAMLITRYRRLRERFEQASQAAGADVMVSPADPELSRLQSWVAAMALEQDPLGPGGEEVKFGTGFQGRDWYHWIKCGLLEVDRAQAHPFIWSTRPPDTIADTCQIAMAGDWGTGLYGAPRIADRIRETGPFDLLLHLGDIYYSGAPDEVKKRFIELWPFEAGTMTRVLNGNHEMYSGGFGYFQLMLPACRQPASYFAFQNTKWLLIGLDTAYVDHDMNPRQVTWLTDLIERRDGRKVVLFSHQQLFSRLSDQGTKLEPKLRDLLTGKAITAWYWGHEHECVLYDRHPEWGFTARCLGNGGIPEPRPNTVVGAPREVDNGVTCWRRLAPDPAKPWAPSCLVLDGPNLDVKGREEDFGPHAYMTLSFRNEELVERVFLANGTKVYEGSVG